MILDTRQTCCGAGIPAVAASEVDEKKQEKDGRFKIVEIWYLKREENYRRKLFIFESAHS